MYYTYMLRCMDDTIYTGITTDVERRMTEHFSKNEKCAKYTSRHTAKKLETVFESSSRVLASKLEYRIKTLSKKDKELLINDNSRLKIYFEDKLDVNEYKSIKVTKNVF